MSSGIILPRGDRARPPGGTVLGIAAGIKHVQKDSAEMQSKQNESESR